MLEHEQDPTQCQPGVDDPLGNSPIVVTPIFGCVQEDFGQVDRAPPAADVQSLMAAIVVEVEQRIVANQRKTQWSIDQGNAQILGNFV